MAAAVASATIVATGGRTSRAFQYQDFDNMKPPTFDGIQDPIIAIRWLSDVEDAFTHAHVLLTRRSGVL